MTLILEQDNFDNRQFMLKCIADPGSTTGTPYNIILSLEKADVNLTIMQAEIEVTGKIQVSMRLLHSIKDAIFCVNSSCLIEASANSGWQMILRNNRTLKDDCGKYRCIVRNSNGDLVGERISEIDFRFPFCINSLSLFRA